MDESHKSSPLDQLGVFTHQSLTLIRILVVCSVTLNRFQCNESQCSTPKSPSPGVERGTWGWGPQILFYFINRHCSPPKCFPVRELNPGLEGGVLRVKSANPNSMYRLTLLLSKTFNTTGVELGPCGWKLKILTARPTGTVHSWILNSDALVGRLFCCIAVDFQLIKGLAGLQNFSQSGSRTRDLRVGLECEISKS